MAVETKMRFEVFSFLLTPKGQALLEEVSQEKVTAENHLRIASGLRQKISAEQANAILETVVLRQRAASKFSRASEMYFTAGALEQSSAEIISRYRARRYRQAGFTRLADLGCGIGGDALALAAIAEVTGVEWDPLRLSMAQENIRVYGSGMHFHPLQADLLELSPLPVQALFADPGRRDAYGRRIFTVDEYRPPLSTFDAWRMTVPHQGIKVSPAISYDELPPGIEVEFISVDSEVREGVLWFGDLRSGAGRRATLLPGSFTLTDESVETIPVTGPMGYLYEPDGAVIRAHLVEQLAGRLDASKIDEEIAYLTAAEPLDTPFARCYLLEDVLPFQLKRLRKYLRERGIGRLTIKKRGSPLDPDKLRKRLRLKGEEDRVIFLTRLKGEPAVLVGRELDRSEPGGRTGLRNPDLRDQRNLDF